MEETTNEPAAAPAPPSEGELFARELNDKLGAYWQARERVFSRNQPIASDADPSSCARRQVLEIVRWQDKAPIPASRLPVLEVGDQVEEKGLQRLRDLGYKLVREQETFELLGRRASKVAGRPIQRGKLDAFLLLPHADQRRPDEIPVEVKSFDPYVYASINTADDFNRYWWTKKYLSQMNLYLIGYSKPWGIFWITNRRGDWKAIPIVLDLDHAERAWSFAERIVEAADAYRLAKVESAEEPPLPSYSVDPVECTRCPFFGRACNPPIEEKGAVFILDETFEADLARREELYPLAKEYEKLDEKSKTRLKLGPELQICGRFAIVRKEIKVKGKDKPSIRIEITRVGDTLGGAE